MDTKSYLLVLVLCGVTAIVILGVYLNDWSAYFSYPIADPDVEKNAPSTSTVGYTRGFTPAVTVAYDNVTTSKQRNYVDATLPKCGSCAFIVASGHMIDSRKGKEIDAFDCVFRPNDSPTTGYEADVGEKTTHRIVNIIALNGIKNRLKSGKPFQKTNNLTYIVFWPHQQTLKKCLNVANNLKKSHPEMNFVVMKEEMLRYIEDTFRNKVDSALKDLWISTGIITLLYMGEVCSTITVYGMSDPNYCMREGSKKVLYHFYQPGRRTECGEFIAHSKRTRDTHRYLKEKQLFNKWKGTWKNLTFRNPTWPDL